MDGVLYAEPQEGDAAEMEEEERRYSLPSIKAQHVGGGGGGGPQDPYAPILRGGPNTYPPSGLRRGQSGPTHFQHLAQAGEMGSGSTAGSGGQSSLGHTTMSTAPSTGSGGGGGGITNNGGNPMLFAQTPMTESPKPISPGAMNALQLGHDPSSISSAPGGLGRQRSPSLATQVQQRDFGRRQQGGEGRNCRR